MSKKLYRKTTKNNQPKLDELAAFNSDCTFSDGSVLGYDASDDSIKPLSSVDNFEVNNLTVHCNTTLEGPVTACSCITAPSATITDLSSTCADISQINSDTICNACAITTENIDVCTCVNVGCNVNIGGNLYVCGTEYITDIEQVQSCCDKILLRDGAVSGLAVGCLSGLEVNKYDGTNNTCIGVDNCGTLRVGDSGTCLEPVMTRNEASCMDDDLPLVWDATNTRAITSDDAVVKYESTALPGEPVNKLYGITETESISNMKLKKFALQYFELSNGNYVPKANIISTLITIGSNTDLNIVTISSDFTTVNGTITTTKDSLLTGNVNIKKFYIGETANCKYYDVGSGDGSGSGVTIDTALSNCEYKLALTDGDDLFCSSPTYDTTTYTLRANSFSSYGSCGKFSADYNCAKITNSCGCVCVGVENTTALLHSQIPGHPYESSCIAADCKNMYLCANTSTNAYSCACFNGGDGHINLHAHGGANDSELRLYSGSTTLYSHNYSSGSGDVYSSISLDRGVASVAANGFNVNSSVVCFTGLPTTTCSDALCYNIIGSDCNGVTKKLEGICYDPSTGTLTTTKANVTCCITTPVIKSSNAISLQAPDGVYSCSNFYTPYSYITGDNNYQTAINNYNDYTRLWACKNDNCNYWFKFCPNGTFQACNIIVDCRLAYCGCDYALVCEIDNISKLCTGNGYISAEGNNELNIYCSPSLWLNYRGGASAVSIGNGSGTGCLGSLYAAKLSANNYITSPKFISSANNGGAWGEAIAPFRHDATLPTGDVWYPVLAQNSVNCGTWSLGVYGCQGSSWMITNNCADVFFTFNSDGSFDSLTTCSNRWTSRDGCVSIYQKSQNLCCEICVDADYASFSGNIEIENSICTSDWVYACAGVVTEDLCVCNTLYTRYICFYS